MKDYPGNTVHHNSESIRSIVGADSLGDSSLLSREEGEQRPDIVDSDERVLFEIKPESANGLAEGREQAGRYLRALNQVIVSGKPFSGGTGFQGAHLVQFESGKYVWLLSWRTPEPGVTLYRWRRSQDRFTSPEQSLDVMKWVELSQEEIQQHEHLIEQVMQALLDRRPAPPAFCGIVLRVTDGSFDSPPLP